MTSTLCQSAALALIIITVWVVKLTVFFGVFVKAVITSGETISATLQDHAKTGLRFLALFDIWADLLRADSRASLRSWIRNF